MTPNKLPRRSQTLFTTNRAAAVAATEKKIWFDFVLILFKIDWVDFWVQKKKRRAEREFDLCTNEEEEEDEEEKDQDCDLVIMSDTSWAEHFHYVMWQDIKRKMKTKE